MKTVDVPELDHDKMMLEKYQRKVIPRGRLERRIVANLIAHLAAHGWAVDSVHDGETHYSTRDDMKAAMEAIFAVDDSQVYFTNAAARTHWVKLVLGNGTDLVSDHSYTPDGSDDFDTVMEAFNAEEFA